MQNALSKLKGRDIFLLTLLGVMLVGLLWFYLRYNATRTEIDNARITLDQLETQVLAARQASAELPTLREDVARLRVQRDELLRALPATNNFGSVLGEIRSDVLASGALLGGVAQANVANASLPAGVRPINITLNVDGTFVELYRVLRSLASMSRFSTINSLSLNLGNEIARDPQLSSTMGVTVYTFDPNVAQGAASTPASQTTGEQAAPAAPAAGGSQ